MELNIKSKLMFGYGAVLAIAVVASAITYGFISSVESTQSRIVNLRQPTVIAGMNLSNGVNVTLAGLRGYMILGDDPKKAKLFKGVRQDGWVLIDDSLKEFTAFSKNWTNPGNINRLKEMKTLVEEFRVAQQEIEDIALSSANNPGLEMFNNQFKAELFASNEALDRLLDQAYQASPGKLSMLYLAKLRSSLNFSGVDLLSYINSGSASDLEEFHTQWALTQKNIGKAEEMTFASSALWQGVASSLGEIQTISDAIIDTRSSADWNVANHWLGSKAAPRAIAIQKILGDMRKNQNKLMLDDNEELQQSISATTQVLILGILLAVALGIVISLSLSNKIVGNLNKILRRTRDIADGKLSNASLDIHSNDELQELGEATSIMASNLSELIVQVKNATHDLSSAANQLMASSGETNSSMVSQSNTGHQVSTAMGKMTSTVENMAQNSNLAAEATQAADDQATECQKIMETNIVSINQLATRIESAALTINSLEADTQGVDDIVQVINSIAEQTNLLALNAAIEAARAGDQGRGFAVVADEVRTLAGRTQESTEQISALLDKLKNGTQQAVQVMNEGQQQTHESVDSTQRTSTTLESITQSVSTIHTMNSNIAAAASEQHTVADAMSQSISVIQGDSEKALRCTQETDSAAKLVSQHATNLDKLISNFSLPTD